MADVNTNDKPDNAFEGLNTAPHEDWTDKDPATIGPNGKRPEQVGSTKHLFGTWSD